MSEPTGDTFEIYPVLRYDDAPAALRWLVDAFGFELTFEVPGPEGQVAHAQLLLGRSTIMVGSSGEHTGPRFDGQADQRMGLYVYVPDVEAHYERARAAGARLLGPVRDTEYGSREYAVEDLEGFTWSFGSYRPD